MSALRPRDPADLGEAIAEAAGQGRTLEVIGGGSKRALGRACGPARPLDVSALSGIVDYDPAELVLTALAGTALAEIAALLDGARQMLAFEPPDWRALLGGTGEPMPLGGSGEPTLGGTIATNLSGPRRVRAGAARDHLLGFAAVDGTGQAWKAGGRVVKNVTGYDMCKLQTGAFGTLSVLTELSVRVMPRPETCATLVLAGLSDAAAIAAMAGALNTPHEVSAAAHLPPPAAARAGLERLGPAGGSTTLLRVEGPAPSVAARAQALAARFGQEMGAGTGAPALLDAAETARLWAAIGGAAPLLPPTQGRPRVVWRLCPTPAQAARVIAAIAAVPALRDAAPGWFYDWGGGLIWLSLDLAAAGADAGAGPVRAALAGGGHATLIAAPAALRAGAVFDPEPAPLAALCARIKHGFDPAGLLNPGRMQPGR